MRTCLIALSLILGIEGYLAWASGYPQLLAMLGGLLLVGGIASISKRRGNEWGWAPLVGLYVIAAALTIGVYECGVIVATSSLHFVAWFYAARGARFGAPELAPGTLDGRPGIYSVAFCAAFALALVLVRGGFFPLDVTASVLLAFNVFSLGLLVMEKGRFLRMREGAADRGSRKRGLMARGLAALALLALMFFVFAKPVPLVADGLVAMALDLQGKEDSGLNADDMPDLDEVPERSEPPQYQEPEVSEGESGGINDGTGQRSGDSMSQVRRLPQQADLHGAHVPVLHIEVEDSAQAVALSRRPIYVRSSTLGKYSDNEWRRISETEDQRWIADREDGKEDGRVTLPSFSKGRAPAEIRHRVYIHGSTGAALFALQGVGEFELPMVYQYGDDWYRAQLLGDISYSAASRPLSVEDVLGDPDLRAGRMRGVYLNVGDERLADRIRDLIKEMPVGSLQERLMWVKQFMATHYEYSSKIDNPDDLAPLENFLFAEKRGYCDFFATAGALIARLMDIPSRIGYGYSKGEFDGENIFTFYADGAHSWTEIFLEGHGWVVYDLTPQQGGRGAPAGASVAHGESPDLSGFKEGDVDESDEDYGVTESGGDRETLDEFKSRHSAISDLVAYVLFCVALAAFGLWYYLKRDPEREAAQAGAGPAGPGRKLPPYLAEFIRLLRALGLDPQNGETLVEQLKSLRGAGVPVDRFTAMKEYHYRTHYEDAPADPRLERQFVQEVRSFLKRQLSVSK